MQSAVGIEGHYDSVLTAMLLDPKMIVIYSVQLRGKQL
jgi:hypothetical protein